MSNASPVTDGLVFRAAPDGKIEQETEGGLTALDPSTWPQHRKVALTRAARIPGPFTVETSEGPLRCEDGWLAVDARGYPYPIAADEFGLIYEPVLAAPLQPPSIGRVVVYRSRTGDYDVPAIISATEKTLNRAGVEAGYVPDLSSPNHVHLTVFTPGIPGAGNAHEEPKFLVRSEHPVQKNAGGSYSEWDIPFADPSLDHYKSGTWRWPVIR